MPPLNHDHGPIPVSCYDKSLSRGEIMNKLLEVYLQPERVAALADSDDPLEVWQTKWAIEIVAEIDADTLFWFNNK